MESNSICLTKLNEQGDFTGYVDAQALTEAYNAVTQADAWEWLKKDTTPGKKGFCFCNDPVFYKINDFMKPGHSGFSLGYVMSHMEFIARNGWNAYLSQRVKLKSFKRT